MATDETSELIAKFQPIARDAERLVALHADLLRSELRQTVASISPALTSIGAGAAIAAAGGLLGCLALVHGLHRSTRLPLWGCYGIVGSVLGTAGVGLMGSGSRRLSSVSFIPYETLTTLQEDIGWVTGKTK